MKIAVAADGQKVTQHFGHCTDFVIYEVENGSLVREQSLKNPGHKPGFLPNFLADHGVTVIVSGGIGQSAIEIFNQRGVEVVYGASGDPRAAAESYLRGELKTTGNVCHDHQHHSECE